MFPHLEGSIASLRKQHASQVLAHLRNANTLMGMKSIALTSAPPRIYADLRAAAALGGYYFNFTQLESHLDISDDILSENYTCTAEGRAVSGRTEEAYVETAPGSNYYLKKVAASY